MAKLISDEFMQQVVTEQAWKNLSEEFTWTEALLEKYADKVDWKEISDNCNIIWTVPMLQKFSKRLDWEKLSEHTCEKWFTEAHLEAFKNKWDWSEIVSNVKFSEALIDKYVDYVEWDALIEAHYGALPQDDSFDVVAFYEKYKKYLPMAKIQTSDLWYRIVKVMEKQLLSEILS